MQCIHKVFTLHNLNTVRPCKAEDCEMENWADLIFKWYIWKCIIFGNISNYMVFQNVGGGINEVEWAYWNDQKLPIQIPTKEASGST